MIKRGLVVGVKGFPRPGESFNTILHLIKKSSDTGGVLYEKMQPVLSQRTVVFSCCGAESFYRRESLYGGGMALPWLQLFVSGAFAAEKIKHSCSPGGGKTAGAAILCGSRSYSR